MPDTGSGRGPGTDELFLGFDTSAAHCAAAVVSGDRVLARRFEPMARGQAERLMVLLEETLAEAGVAWPGLSGIGVGVGISARSRSRCSTSRTRSRSNSATSTSNSNNTSLNNLIPLARWAKESWPEEREKESMSISKC